MKDVLVEITDAELDEILGAVTHNLQMLKPQDNVMFFNEISPPEIGTHAQLLETSTLYRTYYKSQIKGDDDAKLCD